MIALLSCLFVLAPPRVIELVDPSSHEISIQAMVAMPNLGAKDAAKLDIIVRAMTKQTQTYPRREMLMVTDGKPVHGNITPDQIRIAVNVPSGKLKAGLSLMESLLREASLTEENLSDSEKELGKVDYWNAALMPWLRPNVHLTTDEAQFLYHRVFRPERVTLAVGGKFAPGDAEGQWLSRLDSWVVEREQKGYFDESRIEPRTTNPTPITTIDIAGAPFPGGDPSLPAKLLALYALGVGKGASLFRVVRENHGWSYRQEAILSPTKDGWLPRLLIATIPPADTKTEFDTIRAELLTDIQSWTEASRLRAIGMAEAVLIQHVRFDPIYALGTSTVGDSLEDRTFLAAYWKIKTGQDWNQNALLASMKQVTLADLKEQATNLITSAIPRILEGS